MNSMTSTLHRTLDRQSTRAQLVAQAHVQLRSEFLTAARSMDPLSEVRTPGYKGGARTLLQVMQEDLADDEFADVLRLLLRVACGEPIDTITRLKASVVVASVANRHAAFHETDAADEAEGAR